VPTPSHLSIYCAHDSPSHHLSFFFFNDTATTEIYTLSLHDALPILTPSQLYVFMPPNLGGFFMVRSYYPSECHADYKKASKIWRHENIQLGGCQSDRKSGSAGMPRPISYAVFCLQK